MVKMMVEYLLFSSHTESLPVRTVRRFLGFDAGEILKPVFLKNG